MTHVLTQSLVGHSELGGLTRAWWPVCLVAVQAVLDGLMFGLRLSLWSTQLVDSVEFHSKPSNWGTNIQAYKIYQRVTLAWMRKYKVVRPTGWAKLSLHLFGFTRKLRLID